MRHKNLLKFLVAGTIWPGPSHPVIQAFEFNAGAVPKT
jgi:hypothetical protein